MLCVYFEIPYERQLIRIAPLEIEAILKNVSTAAVANGATVFKISCAAVYQFSMNTIAPVFSADLFLKFLADVLQTQKRRIMDYRVIIDVCDENDTEDVIEDHFLSYQHILIPDKGFFASPKAEQLLKPYINFAYLPQLRLYHCISFIVPQTASPDSDSDDGIYRIYITNNNISWLRAVYHFMLRYPISDEKITEYLSEDEKKQYSGIKNVVYYFRRHRFCSDYPDYFVDAFALYITFYFRAFMQCYHVEELSIIYSGENEEAARRLSQIMPSIPMRIHTMQAADIDMLPKDFMLLVYLTLYAFQFIFEDELHDFFFSLHKNSAFITNLYEWMYAFGIIEVKDNIYSVNTATLHFLEQKVGYKKNTLQKILASFLWEKYKKGTLSPNTHLKRIFSTLEFNPDEHFVLHNFFYEYSDNEIRQMELCPFKSECFFSALEYYQQALKIGGQNASEAIHAVKNALSSVQKYAFIAGEYRALLCIAFLHLSQNKTEDAITYFHYALDNAEVLHDSGFICETLLNLSIAYFLQNNFNGAMNHLNRLYQAVADYFEQPQKIPCIFMQGRVALQLGEYSQAERLFEEAAQAAARHFKEWEPVCRIWYARTLSQKGQVGTARHILMSYIDDSPDARLFLLETSLLSPVLRNDLSDTGEVYPLYADAVYKPHQSGFALAEELIWGKLYDQAAVNIFHAAFNGYYRFRLAIDKPEEQAAAKQYLEELEDIARAALRHRDMYAALYLYFCYDAFLRFAGDSSDNANGYLSRAFKALQNGMSNITENTIRDKFVLRNVWNAKLYAAAQKNKLI